MHVTGFLFLHRTGLDSFQNNQLTLMRLSQPGFFPHFFERNSSDWEKITLFCSEVIFSEIGKNGHSLGLGMGLFLSAPLKSKNPCHHYLKKPLNNPKVNTIFYRIACLWLNNCLQHKY